MSTSTEPNRFDALCARFPLRPIRSDEHFDRAVEFARSIDRDDVTDDEEDYLEALLTLVEKYQDEHHKLSVQEQPTPAEMLRFMIGDARQESVADVSRGTGLPEGMIEAMMSGTQPITGKAAAVLAPYFNVKPGLFCDPSA